MLVTCCRKIRLLGYVVLGGLLMLSPASADDPKAPMAVVSATDEDKPSQNDEAAPTETDIKQWISQLDNDKFLVRESATQKLTRARRGVIPLLTESVKSGSLEKAFRCIHVLRNFAIGEDVEIEKEATASLEAISENQNDRVAAYAAEVLKRIAPLKEERAIRMLSGLGVKFTSYTAQPIGFPGGLMGPGITIDANYQGTVDDLYYLQHLQFVEDVQISHPKVTAEWFRQIAKMPNLRLMTIKDGPVTVAMLRELEPILPKLQGLRLYYIDVDGSVAPLLAKLTSATVVEFFGLPLSDGDKERMMQELPLAAQASVKFRSGGFLGVTGGGNDVGGSCRIRSVHQDSGAHAAGLQGDDIVTEANGVPVNSFEHLIELLRDKKVGEKIQLKVIRRGMTKELTVVLGKWPLRPKYDP